MKDAVRLRSLFVIGLIGLLLVGMVGSVAAQGPGEQLCHPAGYCVEIPPVPGWSGSFDSTNNILFVSDANETIGYGVQLTYAPGTSGDPASLAQAMDILISSGFSGTPQGDPRPVTLAGFNGLQQPFSTAELGSGMGFVLAVGPDVIAMGVGLRFTGGAWSQVDERGLISFVNSLTVPPTLDATRIIAGGSAPPQVEIFTPIEIEEIEMEGKQTPPGSGGGETTGAALAVGQSVNGTIDDQQFAAEYPLTLQAGETVTITMERVDGDLDSLLILLGPDGAEVARNDDADSPVGDSPLNAQIAGFTAPVSGTYTVRATRFLEESGTSSGQYRLSVTAGGQAAPTATPTPFAAAPTPAMTVTDGLASGPAVSIGQTVTGFIGGDVYAVEYPITLQAGETIAVQMKRLDGDLDPFLVIFDPTNEAVAFNDDAPQQIGDTPFNAHIVGYTAQMDGTYFIRATRYQLDNGTSSGNYRLTVTQGTAAAATSGGAISVGQSITSELTTTTFAVDYTIALQAGQTITVTMERVDDTLDPYLSIMDSSGNELASNDDAEQQVGDSSLNARITDFVAPVNGTYTIRATRYFQEGGSSVGRFQLSVTGTGGTSK